LLKIVDDNILPLPVLLDRDSLKIIEVQLVHKKTRKNAKVEYLDYQIPVTQLKGPKGNGDMQAAKRD